MGTRAMIGIVNESGTITASYCHYDGYLDGVGKTAFTTIAARFLFST